MSQHVIEPRDPMVVRDGRPNRGSSASRTRDFPLPSALAGVVRTRLGSDAQGTFELHDRLDDLLGVGVRGPVLSTLDEGSEHELFVPAPLDAVFLEAEGGFELHALRLTALPVDAKVDHDVGDACMPDGGRDLGDLMLLGLDSDAPQGKPSQDAPAMWAMKDVLDWLSARELTNGCWKHAVTVQGLVDGVAALPRELRTHVAIGDAGTGRDGMLFETEGLRFLLPAEGPGSAGPTKQLAVRHMGLRFEADELAGRALRDGLFPFAGERRLMHMRTSKQEWPALPGWLEDHLRAGERCLVRVMLATPALFEGGFRPGAKSPLLASGDGVQVRLVAARTPSPVVVSGWDMRAGRPKPSRRAVPAGAVYWLELKGSADARVGWAREVWMKNVSCDPQDRLDGWGLAMVGVAEGPQGGVS